MEITNESNLRLSWHCLHKNCEQVKLNSVWAATISVVALFTFIEGLHVLYHMREETPQSRISFQFPTSPIRRITTGVYTSERGLNLSNLRHVEIVNIFFYRS